jgi:hypothetical protein
MEVTAVDKFPNIKQVVWIDGDLPVFRSPLKEIGDFAKINK